MSYSSCFKCGIPVSSYEKYCFKCEEQYKQDDNFWKRPDSHTKHSDLCRGDELVKDKI